MRALFFLLLAALPLALGAETVAELKAAFPPHEVRSVDVIIRQPGKDQNGNPRSRRDKIQVEVPPRPMWDWYRFAIASTTAQTAAERLPQIEQRITHDLASLSKLETGHGESGRKQAELTRAWLNQSLRPYLQRWKHVRP